MRIGIDACCWSNRRGFGRFTRELVTRMVEDFPAHKFILVADRATASESEFPPGAAVHVVATKAQPTKAAAADGARSVSDLWRMGRAVSGLQLDGFFFPAVYSYFPLLRRLPTAIVFHDAIAEHHPGLIFSGFRSRLFWNIKTWLARRQADRLLTVSLDARDQIAAAFGMPKTTIDVIPEGPHAAFRLLDDRAAVRATLERLRLPVDAPLLLYVGGISPHKNLAGLLHALTKVRAAGENRWHLVLAGDYANDSFLSCYQDLTALCARLGLQDRVSFTGYISNDDLVVLYNAATALVLPSFSEGFGLPIVEAMACGTPVAASRRGSLPEVVGTAGLLFDPENHAEMAAVLTRLLDESSLREELRSAGLKRVQQFSWHSAAEKVVQLFERMVGAKAGEW